MKRLYLLVFVLAVVIIAFLSLWRALGFHFWRDDWGNLWELTYHPEVSVYFDNGVSLRRHPGLAVEKVIGNKLFGQDIFSWQVFGIFLRVLDSLAVSLMVYGLTRSKKTGVLAGLFSASLIGGLEAVTWISAHTSALFLFFLSLGVYFWARSFDDSKGKYKNYFLSLIFVSVAVCVTPASGLLILPLLLVWDILSWLKVGNLRALPPILFRNGFLYLTLFGVVNYINSKLTIFGKGDILNTARSVFSNLLLFKNYFSSVGNLLTSWIFSVNEPISLGVPSKFNMIFGLLFVAVALLLFILFLFKKTKELQIAVFFCVWLFLFYLPNWLYEKTLVVGSSHRYVAVSAIALVGLFAIFLCKVKPKFLILFSLVFIVLNIVSANRLLKDISQHRSYKVIQPIWDKINTDVLPNQKDLIFMYQGSDLVWGTSMNWSGSVPFGIKRGITNKDDLPIVTGDRELVLKLLCEKNVYRPSFGGWFTQKERVPISHLYVWKWEKDVLTNVSFEERKMFLKEAPCRVLP